MNADWHKKHKMPLHPTIEQRMTWHIEHTEHCNCRAMPPSIQELIKKKKLSKAIKKSST